MGSPKYHFKPDEDLITAFGRLTFNASFLEMIARTMYMRLLTTDLSLAERVVADATMQWLIDHTRVLVHYRFPTGEDRGLLEAWLARVDRARASRNRIVHSTWYVEFINKELKYGLMKATTRRRAFKVDKALTSPDEIHGIAYELEQAGLEGVRLMAPVVALMGEFDGRADT